MADHELVGDNAPDAAPPDVVEAKVIASTLVAVVAGVVVAILNGVLANNSLLGGLPPVAQAVILLAVPPVLNFAAGYATPSNRVG